jgi:hypothetical protein
VPVVTGRDAGPTKQVKEAPRTPLLTADVTSTAVSNVFSRLEPAVVLTLRNWKPGPQAGKLRCEVKDLAGQIVLQQEQPFSVESSSALNVPLQVERFGPYTLDATLALSEGAPRTTHMKFAKLPDYPQLTEDQKRASPYGMCVHGAKDNLRLEPFRAAGVVWFRDYAFGWDWLARAKGADKRYAGWPNFPMIVGRYESLGLKFVPCLQGSIKPPSAGQIGPDRAFGTELADILNAFPKVQYWELSNEYDLNGHHVAAEEPIQWANYRAYHKKFAEVIQALGNGELTAVENGRAGIWPERAKACVLSGDFANVGVVNSHHYCGIEPPEVNHGNFNTGFETLRRDEAPSLFFDRMRAVKRAAGADGKPRQSWLTEFGWDTLAGHVVTPYEQAAFLPRAWLMALAAGTDKCFWFFDYDSPTPQNFFDGCGLLGPDGSPKQSLCSLAGLVSVLRQPQYVGDINAGENTGGYVFRSDGKLVAGLWTIQGDDGPILSFNAEQLCDWFGNKFAGYGAKLRLAPTYVVGLSQDDPLYKQTAYSFDSPYLVVATAGDEVTCTLQVKNNRTTSLKANISMSLPPGWFAEETFWVPGGPGKDAEAYRMTVQLDGQAVPVRVKPGETKLVPMTFTVGPKETLGKKTVMFTIIEDQPLKKMPLQVLVQQPLIMQVGPIMGQPGKAEVKVKLGNQSAKPVTGTLSLRLPAAWKTEMPEQKIDGLKPFEIREVKCALEWNTNWTPEESAKVVFATADGKSVERPIIPKRFRLHRAPQLSLDGKLEDWPAACEFPAWMLGSTLGETQARLFMAWSPEGLYGAVEVHDSKLIAVDARSFWNGDCLELFIDTADDKRHREFEPGDHQFWLVPQVDANRAYVGLWKRKNEIPATVYDLPGVKGAARRLPDGYAMEFLIPASAMQKYDPKAGGKLGLSANLTIKGQRYNREVYWPWTKTDWAQSNWPKMWGSLELVQ